MKATLQKETEQPVQVVEADVFDEMNETRSLIAERAYEIYQERGGGHGHDQEDWFQAEGEVLPKIDVDWDVTSGAVLLTARVPGFRAKDLEVEVGHRRAVLCGIHHPGSNLVDHDPKRDKKVMRIIEFPFDIDPARSAAKLQGETLHVLLPRSW